jgi:hypothetical protein
MKQTEVIIIRETWQESVKRDAGTLALAVLLMVPGWMLGITALTVTGVIIFWITMLTWTARVVAKSSTKHKTLYEARDHINAMIAAQSGEAP